MDRRQLAQILRAPAEVTKEKEMVACACDPTERFVLPGRVLQNDCERLNQFVLGLQPIGFPLESSRIFNGRPDAPTSASRTP